MSQQRRGPGFRYGNLDREQIAALSPFFRGRLPERGMSDRITSQIANAGTPELTLARPDIPQEPNNAPPSQSIQLPQYYGSFNNIALSIGLDDQLVLTIPPGTARRIYLMVINTHATQNLFLNFQTAATAFAGLPIINTYGFVEYNIVVPQDDVHIIANGATTTGVLIFSNKSMLDAS